MSFRELDSLRIDSGTGPDNCPAKILQYCSRELAAPVTMLIMRIFASMQWPEMWREHWIIPIHKKLSTFLPGNYRGVHLTAQLSKVVERLIKRMLDPYLERTVSYGYNQFAYRQKRGSRDVLALLMLEWLSIFDRRGKIGFYCSDVSGAFDKVDSRRLASKLRAKGINQRMVNILISWLEDRQAKVAVGGCFSEPLYCPTKSSRELF